MKTNESEMNSVGGQLGATHWHGTYGIEWNGHSKIIEQGHAVYIPKDDKKKIDEKVQLFDQNGDMVPLPRGKFRIVVIPGRNVFCIMDNKSTARAA